MIFATDWRYKGMSADNYTTCPKCLKRAEVDNNKEANKIADAYGKVPMDKYLDLVKNSSKPIKLSDTLREDYDIGMDGGDLHICYRASCRICDFKALYSEVKSML
jgi:hypothetical protein